MKVYKGVLVAKGSKLYDALEDKDEKAAKKIFGETTERYKAMYSAEDRAWFAAWTNEKEVVDATLCDSGHNSCDEQVSGIAQ